MLMHSVTDPADPHERLLDACCAAIERGEIDVLFQPQFRIQDGAIVGAEALARWAHPIDGAIAPEMLFMLAAERGCVPQLTRHVAHRALAVAAGWPDHLRLSVNITPADVAAPGFASDFAALVAQARFEPARLTVEITEEVLLADVQAAAAVLGKLRALGIAIALDDFGAGFCNFRYLKLLPLSGLKLDRTMVEGIADDPRDLAVLRGICAMARALGLVVTVEGIEMPAQLAAVSGESCETYQGFLSAPPMSAADFAQLAAQQR